MKNRPKKEMTTAKGYRLKPSTHRKVKRACKLLNLSYDFVISRSMKLLFGEIKKEKVNNKILNNQEKGIL